MITALICLLMVLNFDLGLNNRLGREQVITTDPAAAEVARLVNDNLMDWVEGWRKVAPGYSPLDLQLIAEKDFELGNLEVMDYQAPADAELMEQLAASPNGEKLLNPYVGRGIEVVNGQKTVSFEPDSAVELIDLKTKKQWRLFTCGTPCGFDDAFWINDHEFVVVGSAEYYPPGGEARCTEASTCTYVPTVRVVNLSEETQRLYYGPEVIDRMSGSQYLKIRYPDLVIK